MYEFIETVKTALVPYEPLIRLVAAAVLGGIVGIEREHHGRSAGFRTQLLVALGSALAMVVSLHFAQEFGNMDSSKSIRIDPARIAYGVMGGIGFLGAGAIIRYGVGVRGLTTAASLWCSAAVGLACGFGMYKEAAFATFIVIFALVVLSRLEFLFRARIYKSIAIKFPTSEQDNIARCREIFEQHKAKIVNWSYRQDRSEKVETITFHICLKNPVKLKDITTFVKKMPDVLWFDIQ